MDINPMRIKQGIIFNIILLLAALLPRLALFVAMPPLPEKILTPLNDSTDYDFLAQEILKGRYCAPSGEPTAFRPPLYPAFLAVIYFFAGTQNLKAVAIAQVFLGVLNAFLCLWTTRQMTGSRLAARLAALGAALYPAFILQAVQILSEDFSRMLFLASLYFLFVGIESKKPRLIYLSGIFFGLSVLNKSVFLGALPFIIVWVYCYWNGLRREKFKIALIYFTCPILLFVGAWTIRNAAISGGKFIPVSTNYPITFAHGVTRFSYYANLWYGRERLMPVPDNYQELTQMRFYRGVREELEIGNNYAYQARRFMRDNKRFMVVLTIRKAIHFWSPFIRNTRWAEAAAFLSMAPVLLLGWIGIIRGFIIKDNRMRKYSILALMAALPVTLPYALSQPDVRYRVGTIEIILLMFAGWALYGIIQRFHLQRVSASSGQGLPANHGGSGRIAKA